MKRSICSIYLFLLFLCPFLSNAQSPDTLGRNKGILSAVEFYNKGDYAGATVILKDILRSDPDEDAARYYLGICLYMQKDIEGAQTELKKAVSIDPDNFWYRYRLAWIYSAAGKAELTLDMYEQMVRDFPKKYELYYDMVDLYLAQGQNEKALETLNQIETVFGRNEMTVLAKFDLLRKIDRPEEAYECLEKYNSEFSSAQVLSLLADRQLSQYKDSVALAMYEEALDIAPGYAPAMLGKAEAYRMTRKYDKFFDVLYDFVGDEEISPAGKCSYIEALVRSSGPSFMRVFSNQMDSLVTGCINAHPGDSIVNLTVGKYYYSIGNNEKAKERFAENVALFPESMTAAANYAELLMYMHQWDSLSTHSMESYRKFPEEVSFLELASLGEYNKGNIGKVIEICRKVIEVSDGDSLKTLNAYTTMGDMYYQTGDSKRAYKAYDKALKINPEYAPVLNNYAYYLSLEKKKLSKALAMSKKTIDQSPDNSTYLDTYGWILYLQKKYQEAKPVLKNAVMLYGGKESAVVLDHYAEILYALKEYDLAFLYWKQAKAKDDGKIKDLDERISRRKAAIGRK